MQISLFQIKPTCLYFRWSLLYKNIQTKLTITSCLTCHSNICVFYMVSSEPPKVQSRTTCPQSKVWLAKLTGLKPTAGWGKRNCSYAPAHTRSCWLPTLQQTHKISASLMSNKPLASLSPSHLVNTRHFSARSRRGQHGCSSGSCGVWVIYSSVIQSDYTDSAAANTTNRSLPEIYASRAE